MRFGSAYNRLQRFFRFIAMVALGGLVLVTAVDVLGRVLFNAPLGFAYELIGILLGIAVYSGLISVNAKNEHIRIDLFEETFEKWRLIDLWRDRFSGVLELLFFGVLAVYIGRQATVLMRWNETFLFLNVEKWVPISVFCGLASIAVFCVIARFFPTLDQTQEDTK